MVVYLRGTPTLLAENSSSSRAKYIDKLKD